MAKWFLVSAFVVILLSVCVACMRQQPAFSQLASYPARAPCLEPASLVSNHPYIPYGSDIPPSSAARPYGNDQPPVRVIPPILNHPFQAGPKTMELPQPYDIHRD